MPGAQYIALSGLRSRLEELDRISTDIANVGTAGYKGQRGSQRAADRPTFGDELQTAIDTVTTGTKIDFSTGAVAPTGRPLDVAIEGSGFFVVETDKGIRYTRDGHFSKTGAGTLVTSDGATVQGADGPLTLGSGEVRIDEDGTVYAGTTKAGKLAVVTFGDANKLSRDKGAMLRNDAAMTADPVAQVTVRSGALEGSNVSVAERLSQLTNASRSFESLQKAITMVMNEVDGKSIEMLGRR